MTDHMINNPEHSERMEYERSDLSAAGVFSFLLGLAVAGVIIHFALIGLYNVLNNYQKSHQPPQNPLATSTYSATRDLTPRDILKFPEPRLEANERTELNSFRSEEEQKLNSYGWVDQNAGVVHIPIEQAMQIVAQRGLPVRPANVSTEQISGAQQKNKIGSKPPGRPK
jgi:hypothetical protein